MKIIERKSFVPFRSKFLTESPVVYDQVLNSNVNEVILNRFLDELENGAVFAVMTAAKLISGIEFVPMSTNYNINGHQAIYFPFNTDIIVDGKQVQINSGSFMIVDKCQVQNVELVRDQSIILYQAFPSQEIFENVTNRLKYSRSLKKNLKEYFTADLWKQSLPENITRERIGEGCYGNVWRGRIDFMEFALKLAKIKPEAIAHPFSPYYSSWFEPILLSGIIRSIVVDRICPNLPMIYGVYTSKKCQLMFDKKKERHHCVMAILELAQGTLKSLFQAKKLNRDTLLSILFQVMAALHAIQTNGQIMNYDVKLDNILYYKICPGGYWRYTLYEQEYYVPNYGYLIVLNDFGISRPMSPNLIMTRNPENLFRLGSRYALLIDRNFSPIEIENTYDSSGEKINPIRIKWKRKSSTILRTNGGQYRMEISSQKILNNSVSLTKKQQKFLYRHKLEFGQLFVRPEIFPPFEFYNDTQDAIRMFVGGKRTTQRGNHREFSSIQKEMSDLKNYLGLGESMDDHIFELSRPDKVLAGRFIESYFGQHKIFTSSKNEKIIENYDLDRRVFYNDRTKTVEPIQD